MLVIRNCFTISFYMDNNICTVRFAYLENDSSLKKQTCMCYENIQVQGNTNSTYQFRLSMSDAESCRQTAKVSQIDKTCLNPTIIKNQKLIKLSCHPFALRCLRREFLLFFIDMRGSYVVCVISRKSSL
jgi:hypothetical protein